MKRFTVDYTFQGSSSRIITADSLEDAQAQVEKEVDGDDFELDADEIDDVDFTVREMHPVTRAGKEVWTTYPLAGDVRGHLSALLTTPLFAGAPT